jgi:acyl-CoA oxidase
METHRPFPGIEVGDIGPKFGFDAKDNGYMIFKNYRIPRRNLLSRYLEVDHEGNFMPKGNPKILYSIMMFTRLQLNTLSSLFLARALIVGI